MTDTYGSHFDGSQWPWRISINDGWFAIFDAHDRYISDACVEGDVDQLRDLGRALERGDERYRVKRCAFYTEGDNLMFCSPRNTLGNSAALPAALRQDLAAIIADAIATYERTDS